jgi:hypothetical protein
MQKALSNKLEVFLHHNIQRILRISMFSVKEERLHNKHVRKMFYDIPQVENMIAAHQLNFLGKTTRGPQDHPAQQMLTTCCDNVRQVGRPILHNKDYIVKNLHLLFATVPEVTINDYGSLKHWIREALDEKYWNNLIACLLDQQASIPPRPDKWPQPRCSPRNYDAPPSNPHPFPPTPPKPNVQEDPIPQQQQTHHHDEKIQHPAPLPPVPRRCANNNLHPHPPLKQTEDKTTYLNKWDKASMIP